MVCIYYYLPGDCFIRRPSFGWLFIFGRCARALACLVWFIHLVLMKYVSTYLKYVIRYYLSILVSIHIVL